MLMYPKTLYLFGNGIGPSIKVKDEEDYTRYKLSGFHEHYYELPPEVDIAPLTEEPAKRRGRPPKATDETL